MSKNKLAHTIHKELIVLNERIDRKIIQGKSYIKEASEHKALLRQLQYVRQDSNRNIIFNMFSFR